MAELIPIEEAAKHSKYSASHVRYLIKHKLIEGKKVSVLWLVDPDSLLDYEKKMDKLGKAKHRPKSLDEKPDNAKLRAI